MRILLVGEGAREHAIAEQLAKDNELYALMGRHHPGIAPLAKRFWICNPKNPSEIARCISNEKFDLGFVSPDALLAAGISDILAARGIPIASPTQAAARIEWDKSFMRTLMEKYKLPGQIGHVLAKNESEAQRAIRDFGEVAIKPFGLTGGKGVKLSGDHFTTESQALDYARACIQKDGGVLIEEKLDGEEFSFQVFSDGVRIAPMPPVQDHKRALEKDLGSNTGGMGSYSTGELLPFLERSDIEKAMEIARGAVHALRKEGTPFRGVLYTQCIATSRGIQLIEFNARFGDPEAINVLALLNGSLGEIFKQISEGRLKPVSFRSDCTVVKYLVPSGYPDSPSPDSPVSLSPDRLRESGAKAYWASVYEKEGRIYTTSSRAVAMLGAGATLEEAESKAERACRAADGNLRHRRDIGTAPLVEKRVQHMHSLRGMR